MTPARCQICGREAERSTLREVELDADDGESGAALVCVPCLTPDPPVTLRERLARAVRAVGGRGDLVGGASE